MSFFRRLFGNIKNDFSDSESVSEKHYESRDKIDIEHQSPKIISSSLPSRPRDLKSFIMDEIEKSGIFKEDQKSKALGHLLGQTDLLKIGKKLTADEKKALAHL